MLNKKMLLAPVLAVTLALLLAGAVSFLPQTILQNQPNPHPTSSSASPATPLPTTQTASAISDGRMVALFFGIAALVVGVVTASLFFSEKKLNKEIHG